MRMPCNYTDLNGKQQTFDLDSVIDVVRGFSGKREKWNALVVYLPREKKFIELRDSIQDVRGNAQDEAEEITIEYLMKVFDLSDMQVRGIFAAPKKWKLLTRMT